MFASIAPARHAIQGNSVLTDEFSAQRPLPKMLQEVVPKDNIAPQTYYQDAPKNNIAPRSVAPIINHVGDHQTAARASGPRLIVSRPTNA